MRTAAGPSEHLTWRELACNDGTPYPEAWRESRAVELALEFERIRAAADAGALVVDSAFRTADYNRQIGGAPRSQHVEGRALDLRPPLGWSVRRLADLVLELRGLAGCRIRGVGIYGTFVHVDTRPGYAATWYGSRAVN